MGWYESIKRYVWDDEKTPYLIPVGRLSHSQVKQELFVYTFLLATLFALATLILLTSSKSDAKFGSFGLSLYAFSVFCSAVILGMHKSYSAAVYAASAPLAVFLYILGNGLGSGVGLMEKFGLVIFALFWFRYALRIMAMAKAFPDLADGPDQS